MKKLLLPALVILALASCNNEEIENIENNEPVAITFGQSLGLYSKAPVTDVKLPKDSEVGVYAIEYTGTPAWVAKGGNFMENIKLTADNNGNLSYTVEADKKYYSYVKDTKYDFYAYYPYADGSKITANDLTGSSTPTITVTLENQSMANQQDIMYANALDKKKSANAISLAFNHALAQVKFIIKKDANVGASELNGITINANSKGTLDLTTGTWSGTNTKVDFAVLSGVTLEITEDGVDANVAVMLFPEALEANSVTFNINGDTYTYNPSITLEANKILTITVKVKAAGVTFSQSINPWENKAESGEIG